MFQDLNQIIDYILYNYLYWIHTRNEDNNMEHNPCSLATPPGIINTPNVWILFGHSDIIVGLQLTSQSLRSCHVVNSNKINNLPICQFNPSGDCGRTRSTILKRSSFLFDWTVANQLFVYFRCERHQVFWSLVFTVWLFLRRKTTIGKFCNLFHRCWL